MQRASTRRDARRLTYSRRACRRRTRRCARRRRRSAKGEEPLAAAADHVDAADAVAARLGATRARLESLNTEEPEAARAAVDAALGAARDPCAVAGTLAALHCGALKAGITRWGETMTGCAHALDVLASPKCAAGVDDADARDYFPGSTANNAHGRAHNGIDARACVETVVKRAMPCPERCGDAFLDMASACGGVVPRAGRWRHDAPEADAAKCSVAVSATHDSCQTHRACRSIVEAVPLIDSVYLSTRRSRYARAYKESQARLGVFDVKDEDLAPPHDKLDWADQNVWGAIPEELCHDDRLELDARGNNLQGKPPSCAWESAKACGAVMLSRNRLSGVMNPLGDVHTVHAGFNKLSGDAGDVFSKAVENGLRKLIVNDNNFTSRDGLARLGGSKRLEVLDVSSNALGPAGSATLANDLASFPALTRYDVGGNAWDHAAIAHSVVTDANAKKRPEYVALHAQVTLPARDALLDMCGHCPEFEADIGESKPTAHAAVYHCIATNGCEGYDTVEETNPAVTSYAPRVLDAITCAIRAAIEPEIVNKASRRAAKLAEDATAAGDDSFIQPPFTRTVTGYSRWDVTLVEGSPEPQANGDGFVFAYTLTPSTRHGPVADGALLEALEKLKSLPPKAFTRATEECAGMNDLTPGMDGRVHRAAAKTRDHLKSAKVETRGACPVGRMGAKCDYACATSWSRTATHVMERGGLNIFSDAELSGEANPHAGFRGAKTEFIPPRELYQHAPGSDSERSKALITRASLGDGDDDYDDDASTECTRQDAARGLCFIGSLDPIQAHSYVRDSTRTPRPVLAYELDQCTSSCRGHANLAVHECKMWLLDKSHARQKSTCRASIRDMLHRCGVHSHDHYGEHSVRACEGKAQRAFVKLGAPRSEHESGCETCGVVHYFEAHGLRDAEHHPDTGASLGSAFVKHERVNFEDTQLAGHARHARALHDRFEREEREKAAALGDEKEEEEATTTNDVDLDNDEVFTEDADALRMPASTHHSLARETTYEHSLMFPTCSVNLHCTPRCYTHVHGVLMRRCIAWIEGDDNEKDGCEEAIEDAPRACLENERVDCVDSVATGFRALLDPTAMMTTATIDEEEDARTTAKALDSGLKLADADADAKKEKEKEKTKKMKTTTPPPQVAGRPTKSVASTTRATPLDEEKKTAATTALTTKHDARAAAATTTKTTLDAKLGVESGTSSATFTLSISRGALASAAVGGVACAVALIAVLRRARNGEGVRGDYGDDDSLKPLRGNANAIGYGTATTSSLTGRGRSTGEDSYGTSR